MSYQKKYKENTKHSKKHQNKTQFISDFEGFYHIQPKTCSWKWKKKLEMTGIIKRNKENKDENP